MKVSPARFDRACFGNWKTPRTYYAPHLPLIPTVTPRSTEPAAVSPVNIFIGADRYVRLDSIDVIESNGTQDTARVWITLKGGYAVRSERPLDNIIEQITALGYTLDQRGQGLVVIALPRSAEPPEPVSP